MVGSVGWHSFWTGLTAIKTDRSSYDLLLATVMGGDAVMLALWFTVVVTIRRGPSELFTDWGIIGPATLMFFCCGQLGADAWGFQPPRWGLPAVAVIGLYALWGYLHLANRTLRALAEDS